MPDPAHKPVILIVDDEDANRYILRRILLHAGFEVREARTGSDGLAQAMNLPDLVISDVNLPDMLGYEVSRRLKASPLTRSIPILQISASFTSSESKVQGLEGGADSYLTQPIEPPVLIAQVNALLRMRRAESLSHLSALQWQLTFDSLSDGLALADAQGNVVRANTTFMRLLDLTHDQLQGHSLATVFDSFFAADLATIEAMSATSGATELSAHSRWFRVRYDRIESDPANPGGSIMIVTEITDQRKLQETLKLSERQADTGRLAHIIAHEINNPLEAMSNLLYLASSEDQSAEERQSYIAQASVELGRISTITKQILAYHRESAQASPTPAQELLESVLAMFRMHLLSRGVQMATHAVCRERILVRPSELRQVFSNLITNALDAMESGGRLNVRCISSVRYPTAERGVRFVFSDNGSGIPADVLPRIYEAFYTTKAEKGSGIGLWLSAEVVAKYGGSLRVRTRTEGPYRGTLFDVFLPAV